MEMDTADGAPHDHSAHMGHGGHSGHSMSMAFHFRISETVLFDAWKIETVGGMVGSCVAVFIIALLFEGIKAFREYLVRRESRCNVEGNGNAESAPALTSCFCATKRRRPPVSESGEHTGRVRIVTGRTWRAAIWNRAHLIQTLLHIVQFIVGYSLMLIFMTYNIWLCLAVVAGIGVGYLVFGWDQPNEDPSSGPQLQNGDCCH